MPHNPFRCVRYVTSLDAYSQRREYLELLKSRKGSRPRQFFLDPDGRSLAASVVSGESPVGVFCDWLEDNASALGDSAARDVRAAAAALLLRGGFFDGPKKRS